MSAVAGLHRDRDEPLPPPWPARGGGRLSRRQSIVGWIVGTLVGLLLAAVLIGLMAGVI
jgi:hypothetical protein